MMAKTHLRSTLLVVLLVTSALLILFLASILVPTALRTTSPARANHQAGATYTGNDSAGGEVSLTVSADGTKVEMLHWKDTANACLGIAELTHFNIDIEDHQFQRLPEVSGSFPSPELAEGTLSGLPFSFPPCDELTWSANLGAPGPTTPTPTPTTAPTPTPSPTPTATPAPVSPNAKGNVDCDGDIDAVDALKELRHVAALTIDQEQGCPPIGSEVASIFGDVDCDDDVDAVDALFILRYVAALPGNLPAECPPIGG